jgi:hypothetical protein
MRGRPLSVLVACWLALLLAPSCRQIVGIGDQPPGGSGGSPDASAEASTKCGGFPWIPDACEACVQGSCCTPATNCRMDDLCASEFDCIAACPGGDDACRATCISPLEDDDAMAALASCQAGSCAKPCGLKCGGYEAYFGGPLPSPADAGPQAACLACLEAPTYCDAIAAIASCPSCLELEFCGERCRGFDDICNNNCAVAYPITGLGADSGLLNVIGGACSSACPSGVDWSCVGQVTWPRATVSPVTYRLQVMSFSGGAAVDGAQIRLCPLTDYECDSPLSPQIFTTDANGVATLMLPAPYVGYFEITAQDFVPELLVVTPTIVESMLPGTLKGTAVFPSNLFPAFVSNVVPMPDTTTLGVLFIGPYDCDGQPAPNVSFAADPMKLGPSAAPYYLVNGTTPDPQAKATSNAGQGSLIGGGWVQVAPGLVPVTATVDGTRVALQGMPVRAGALTVVYLVPTP